MYQVEESPIESPKVDIHESSKTILHSGYLPKVGMIKSAY